MYTRLGLAKPFPFFIPTQGEDPCSHPQTTTTEQSFESFYFGYIISETSTIFSLAFFGL